MEGLKYLVIVRAGTNIGLSKPTEAVKVILSQGTRAPDLDKKAPPTSDNRDGIPEDQLLGKSFRKLPRNIIEVHITL